MEEKNRLKPDKKAFVQYRSFKTVSYSLFILLFLYALVNLFFSLSIFYFLGLFLVFNTIAYYWLLIRFKKEEYVIQEDRIIHKTGSLFSAGETELIFRNITHVSLKLPFPETHLFETGQISVDSAGGAASEIVFSSISNPKKIFDLVQKRMVENGFTLSTAEQGLIQKERPYVPSIVLEMLGNVVGLMFTVFIIFSGVIAAAAAAIQNSILFLFLGLVLILYLITYYAIKFMEMKNRTYYLYEDLAVYEDDFLTKAQVLVPIENLADSATRQSFIDKILKINHVILSCQGAGSEINFNHMRNGLELDSNLDQLISETRSLVGKEEIPEEEPAEEKTPGVRREMDTSFTAEYTMNFIRALSPAFLGLIILLPFGIILLPLLPVLIIAVGAGAFGVAVEAFATTFRVKPRGFEQTYDLFSSKSKFFTLDKVTGLVFKENPLDRFFNTCTIEFWSIGSAQSVSFKHIPRSPGLYDDIVQKLGVTGEEKRVYELDPSFSTDRFVKANLYKLIFLGLLLLGSLVLTAFTIFAAVVPLLLIIGLVIWFLIRRRFYENCHFNLFEEHMDYVSGILFKKYYVSFSEHVRDLKSVKYPWTRSGAMVFDIAGERVQNTGNQNQSSQAGLGSSNKIQVDYVKRVREKHDLMDLFYHHKPAREELKRMESDLQKHVPKPAYSSKPSASNLLSKTLLVSIILAPLVALLPITLPLSYFVMRAKSYHIYSNKVAANAGILFKERVTVLFERVDFIDMNRGFFNKIFKNGNVYASTTGSGSPEFQASDLPDYTRFHELLKKHYRL